MRTVILESLLAAGGDVGRARDSLTSTEIWQFIQRTGYALGALVVVIQFFRILRYVMAGSTAGVVKNVLSTVVVAGILFNLDLVFQVIEFAGRIVETVIDNVTGYFSN